MKSILNQLQDEQGMLLMYIAGELPPQDHATVDQRLASDAQLRARLETLRGTVAGIEARFAEADASDHSINAERAITNVSAAVRRMQREAALVPREPEEVRRLLLPWWMYPLAAAASILVAAAVFMANTDPENLPAPNMARYPSASPQDVYVMTAPVLEPQGVASLDAYRRAEDLAASFESGYITLAEADLPWVNAQRELKAIQDASESPWTDIDLLW